MATTDLASLSSHRRPKRGIEAEPPECLSSPSNPIRQQLTALLCAAVYDEESPEAASRLIDECLTLCSNSKERLSRTLQTNFIDDNTPLLWVIIHAKNPGPDLTSAPPLIKELLDHSAPKLSPEAIKQVNLGCCIQNSNALYQSIRRHPLMHNSHQNPGTSTSYTHPTGSLAEPQMKLDGNSIEFQIPNFPDRMLMSDSVEFPFILAHCLYVLRFNVEDRQWKAGLRRHAYNTHLEQVEEPESFRLSLAKLGLGVNDKLRGTVTPVASGRALDLSYGVSLGVLRQRNDYIGQNRQLSGRLALNNWVPRSPGSSKWFCPRPVDYGDFDF